MRKLPGIAPAEYTEKRDSLKKKFENFMQGRYGVDFLNKFLMGLALVLILLSIFARGSLGALLDTAGLVIIIIAYYRIFSRNIVKRYDENQKFLAQTEGIRRWFRKQKNIMVLRKDYHIYTCPQCKQKIRIPRGKGKIEISCPKCGTKFVKKS